MRSGFNSLPSSHPPTPQAVPAVDTYLMDLQHKLASLSMASSNQQQPTTTGYQHQPSEASAGIPQLPSPSSSKESTPQMGADPSGTQQSSVAAAVAPPPDQVDQAATASPAEPSTSSKPTQRKVLPSTIDIHDLETELAKLHSHGKVKETSAPPPEIVPVQAAAAPLPAATSSPAELVVEVDPTAEPQAVVKAAPAPPEVVPTVPAVLTVATEQKAIQTEPQQQLQLPGVPPPSGRKVSRFCVSLVDEKVGPDQPLPPSLDEPQRQIDEISSAVAAAANDPELRQLLVRQETERKALARKHEEELAAFHAQRKLHQQQQQQQQQSSQETSRTPSPGAAAVRPGSAAGQNPTVASSSTSQSSPNSVPGTPTRQANRTFTDDLLRLVQDLGTKGGLDKNKQTGDGSDKVKAPTLNQLRSAGGGGGGTNSNNHSLTQTAGA